MASSSITGGSQSASIPSATKNSSITGGGSQDTYNTTFTKTTGAAGNVVFTGTESTSKGDLFNSSAQSVSSTATNTIFGLGGNDVFQLNNPLKFVVYGGGGNDTVTGSGISVSTLNGGEGADYIELTGATGIVHYADSASITGAVKIDTTTVSNAHDLVDGGAGNDYLNITSISASTIHGAGGNDIIKVIVSAGGNEVTGDDGDDNITFVAILAKPVNTSISGASKTDFVSKDELIRGGAGNDTITVSSVTGSVINGGTGDDSMTINASGGGNIVTGGEGNDYIRFVAAANLPNNASISGADRADLVKADSVYGGEADEILRGSAGNDTIIGSTDDELLRGGTGKDSIDGGGGNDTIFGGRGMDTLHGGTGNDLLTGVNGADVILFALGDGQDTIADFRAGEDKLSFTGLKVSDVHISIIAPNTVLISYGVSDSILLQGSNVSGVSQADLLFT